MKLRPRLLALLLTLGLCTVMMAFQRDGFSPYGFEEEESADTNEKAEFTFARLRYAASTSSFGGFRRGGWAEDFPKADRQFVARRSPSHPPGCPSYRKGAGPR